MYGVWIAETRAPGFALSGQLTVFAKNYPGHYLKMVGLEDNGIQEGRNVKDFNEPITLETVRQAWENPTGRVGDKYQVKDTSSCSPGKAKS